MWPRILAFLAMIVVLAAVLVYSQHRPPQDKVSGFIEAHDIRVGSRVGGRIARVLVDEGATVKEGQPLLELEPFDLNERLAQAQATLAQRQALLDRMVAGFRKEEVAQAQGKRDQLKAQLEKLRAGPRPQEIDEAQALFDQAQTTRVLSQSNFDRINRAFTARSASQDEMDAATNQLKVAQASEAVRQQQLALLKEGSRKEDIDAAAAELAQAEQALALMQNGNRPEDIAAARAEAAAQKAVIAGLQKNVDELRVVAPADGVLEAVDIRPGDMLAPNAPALSMLETRLLWVRAYVPENRLDITTGKKVRVTVDSFKGKDFEGEVTFVSRDAEFTPGNVQTPEERSKQVFRIRVTLKDPENKLRAGMSADVWLK